METLPDYLEPGLDLVFVGINPGLFSAQQGHYFANLRNRFWPSFNAAEMAPIPFTPETDYLCMKYSIGFTDVVKRPTRGMSELKPADEDSPPSWIVGVRYTRITLGTTSAASPARGTS